MPASGFWFCIIVDEKHVANPCYTHYAFTVAEKDFDNISNKILQAGATIFQENTTPVDRYIFLIQMDIN